MNARHHYAADVVAVCREALARGPLTVTKGHYRFGRRQFNPATVGVLIQSGEAERRADGSIVAVIAASAS